MKTKFCQFLLLLALSLAEGAHCQTYSELHMFSQYSGLFTNHDGALPESGLALTNDVLYGATYEGGTNGTGSLFSINTDGTGFKALHSFTAESDSIAGYNTDGGQPYCTLLIYSNLLYGTASGGGPSSLGSIYRVNLDGTGFTNLYSFPNTGGTPYAGLIAVSNVLYGTSTSGGSLAANFGSVFRINPDGTHFTNIITFYPSATNVAFAPKGGLIYDSGKFYGTCSGSSGTNTGGTIFSIGINGRGFTNLFTFQPVSGANRASTNTTGGTPSGSLILVGSTLFGVTPHGGTNGNGVIFAINTDGSGFTNLHTFSLTDNDNNNTNIDGAIPEAALTLVGSTLYGTAGSGGPIGEGTIFSFSPNGSNFKVVWGFPYIPATNYDNLDGESPAGGVIASGSTLYGTSVDGGLNGNIYSLALSNITTPASLGFQTSANALTLTWDTSTYALQSTSLLGTAFTNLSSATSPYVVTPAAGEAFFRLVHK